MEGDWTISVIRCAITCGGTCATFGQHVCFFYALARFLLFIRIFGYCFECFK
ncbi:hypothetical protein QJS04_geneDACA004916 [Acorus gramineus]|uniref:Uncharacterized protein n=1 Tax=Acorus gramineus TaxID=55184 RepID=A0AAV9BU76_ACOGR|nr:hypothetical protein QJS04_geneDACA004916 [Acorus gramineus]